ncbi:TrbC/VirB2 family protein [Alterisphingorhabdus coralli]|uniref:TrbC/VirB2 family protein n=1 Tax=Alterisphingorhabdus coralli TaxID=3071408 RepID=A0AA97I2S9_9SPHN|nr:TrbC/VirB2 family protein [Parasphingorhabdus sp. SCSIO 66989]WOE76740.1 TrbC/VirB2 family protein [Parasphingorhabdus sp. SCSIO 66989]
MKYHLSKSARRLALLAMLMFGMTSPAFAAGGLANVENFIQQIINFLTGPFGIGIATLAVIFAGLGVMFNRLDIAMFMRIIAGIALVFGSAWMVNLLVGG